MKRSIRASALLLALAAAPLAKATHIVGGNLGYTDLGETSPGSQVYRYQVYMQFYLNCGANSNFPDFETLLNQNPNHTLPVGVYIQDPLNPNADKQLYTTVQLSVTDSMRITPDLPNNCNVGSGLCTELGTLSGTVDLPLNFGGYHLYFQMCCRNLAIANINNPNNTGVGYYAFIPPPLVHNSSPIWLGVPTPFLCVDDTSTFLNSATDPDGDQLIFSFQTPYNSVNAFGGITPPPTPLPDPIPTITWNPGFSLAQPFGAGGYSFINGATGLTSYLPPVQGDYVVAVEVREYRNGQLIGITRRDLQLQAIVCPPNNPPQVTGSLPTNYTVNAGDSICFPMSFHDINNDSLTLTSAGTIFNSQIYNPAATINSPAYGLGSVSSQFCWHTSCAEGQSQPYLFTVSVSDNGCPPKTLDVAFQVTVVPFTGPQTITGPAQVCTGATGSIYSTPAITGATFAWTVSGGTIASGQGTNSIHVNWGAPGAGTVSVSATNALGCTSSPISTSVNIVPLPAVNAGSDVTICAGASVPIGGSPTGPAGSSYAWTPATTLSSASAANPTATPVQTTSYVVQVNNAGCSNHDTVLVTVSVPNVNAGPDTSICSGGAAQLHATGTGSFSWTPSQGLNATNIANPVASPTITTSYVVTLMDSVSCVKSDTVRVTVNQLPVVNAGPDTSFCPNATVTIGGSPTGPAGSTYTWSPSTGLNSTTAANPLASSASTITYTVTVTDTHTCVNSDQITLTLLPLPNVDAGPDQSVCAGNSVQLQGSGQGGLLWTPAFGLSNDTVPDPISNPEATITYTLTVTGGNFCTNSDQTTVTVNVLPNANAGPDKTICIGDSVQIGTQGPGIFLWSPATGLSATNTATPLAFPTVTTTYGVTLTDSLTCARTDSVIVIVNQPPHAGTDGSANSCSNGTAITLSTLLGGNPDAGGTWSPSAVYTPGDGSQNFIYVVHGTAPCPNDTAVVHITETAAANAGIDGVLPVCGSSVASNDLFLSLGGSPQGGGTWSDPFNAPSNGTFTVGDPVGAYTYIVLGTGPCLNDTSHVVTSLIAAANAGGDGAASSCSNGSPLDLNTLLNNNATPNGTWSPSATFTPGGGSQNFTYVVNGAAPCPNDTSHFAITETPAPNAGMDGVLPVCGSSVTSNDLFPSLGGSPQSGGMWTDPFNAPSNGTFTVGDPVGAYTYIVLGTGPCLNDTSHVVTSVIAAANAGGDGAASSCSNGAPINLNTLLNNNAAPNGTWSPSSTFTPGGGSQNFTYVVSGAAPCPNDTSHFAITETQAPNAGGQSAFSVCSGGVPFALITHLSGADTAGTWTAPGGSASNGIFTPGTSPAGAYTYVVLGTGPCANDTGIVTMTVVPQPNAGVSRSVSTCGSGVVFNLLDSLSGTPDPGGAWSHNGAAHSGQFDPSTDPSGVYLYIAGAGGLCPDSATVTVTITNPNANAGSDATICHGDTTQLHASGGTQYAWSPITGLSDPSMANPLADPSGTTTYTVQVTDAGGCIASDAVVITVNALPNANAGPDVSICTGASTPIGGSPTGPPGSSFSWSPISSSSANPTVQPNSTTNFIVTVTDTHQCVNRDTVLVTVNPLPALNAGPDTAFCTGSSVQLNAAGTGSFVWSPSTGLNNPDIANPVASGSSTQTYTVTLTDANQCVSTGQVTVTVFGLPSVNAGSDLYLCPGFNVQLQGSGGGSFSWAPANTLDNATIATPHASPLTTTPYTLTVTDGHGCSASDVMQVNVSTDPPIDAGADQDICQGQTAVLGGSPTSVPGTSFLWAPATSLNDATIANPTATPITTTTYDLTVTSDTCTSHDQVTITLQGVAQAAFNYTLEPTCDAVRAYFTDLSSGGVQWLWNFGDGTTSTNQHPQHFFANGGTVTATLTLTDAFGCTDTVSQVIDIANVSDHVHYDMPNVFTPNGDGVNDVFTLRSNAVLGPCAVLEVFNRWGQKMFGTMAGNIVWDGRNSAGEPCSVGTYFYVITVKDVVFKGDVYLGR